MSGQNLGIELMKYMLGGLDTDGRKDLQAQYQEVRTNDLGDGKFIYYNYDGKVADKADDIQLPPLI